MLKIYFATSLIATGLMLITKVKAHNKNIRAYIQKVLQEGEKPTLSEKILTYIKLLIYCWLPIINIITIFTFLYVLFVSDYKLVKTMDEQLKKTEKEKAEFENILNHRD